jgi:hypothetical protein
LNTKKEARKRKLAEKIKELTRGNKTVLHANQPGISFSVYGIGNW